MTAIGTSQQSVEAAVAGDLHTGVCVTSTTSGCTVAPPSKSASINTHTSIDAAKSRGTGRDVSNSPPPARYHDFVQRLQHSFVRLASLCTHQSVGLRSSVVAKSCRRVIGQAGLSRQAEAAFATFAFTSSPSTRCMDMAERGETDSRTERRALRCPFQRLVRDQIWAANRGINPSAPICAPALSPMSG